VTFGTFVRKTFFRFDSKMFKFTLENYSGAKSRYTCPGCGAAREFTRYLDATGNYLADTVGRCNRESKCGYHYKPKDYFRDNLEIGVSKNPSKNYKKGRFNDRGLRTPKTERTKVSAPAANRPLGTSRERPESFLPIQLVENSIGNFEGNSFVQFLLNLFPDDAEAVNQAVNDYLIGTFQNKTAFWQIDSSWRVRTGKLMRYDLQTGKRIPETFINRNGEKIETKVNWIHARLKKQGELLLFRRTSAQ
jgi:hypothetical protein